MTYGPLFLQINDSHKLKQRQNVAISHNSKSNTSFLDKEKIDASGENIPFQNIPQKSSYVSLMDHFDFGLLQ